MKKNELTRVSNLIAELRASGIVVSTQRESALINSASLADFFGRAFGLKLSETLAGASLAVSIADNNRAIKAANKAGEQTTRTRLIRYLSDASFTARDGVKFASEAE